MAVKPRQDLVAIPHVGIDLWRASQAWKQRFVTAMAERGYGWFAEARGGLIEHIGAAGIAQTALVARCGMTKQAVQQHLDALEADGIIERVADAIDSRRKLIRYTKAGLATLAVAREVKREIEAEYAALLGDRGLADLKRTLQRIGEAP